MRRDEANLLPSVFDRLADVSVSGAQSPQWYDLETLTRAVRRDLEDLLNTQLSIPDLGSEFPGLARSVVGFGVPDPSKFALDTPAGKRQLAAALAHAIDRFEPRLTDVRVELDGVAGEKLRELRFRVIARLVVESAPQVIFESKLHVPTGQISIQDAEA